jgi:DNA-binding GntR family transcriptional regulator
MIRREQLKLTIVGRSPIEHVDVPQVIPKNQRKYFGGAVVAAQSGQTLPALFMLRTFLEQFAASQVSDHSLRADAVIDAYMASLPDAVRSHFISPRDMYSRLSEAIHAAREDMPFYEEIVGQIIEHFEARRLYKVPTA